MRVGKNAFCDFIYQPIEWENLHGQVDSGRTPFEGDHLKPIFWQKYVGMIS